MNGGFGKKEVWPLQCIFPLRKQELLFFLNEKISSSDFESNSLILHKVCSKPNICIGITLELQKKVIIHYCNLSITLCATVRT